MNLDEVAGSRSLWGAPERQLEVEARLQDGLGVGSLVAQVLAARGFTDPEDASLFLNPSLDDLHPATELPDYAAARDVLLDARDRKLAIYVHGDYDVDGVTSAALLTRFLEDAGCNVTTHVPHRIKEGYGIHATAVEAARAEGAQVFLTCDCGSSAVAQVEQARAAGMSVVVTDHHEIGAKLPDANAVVNPHRKDSKYPFKDLSGVGVAFKLCAGLTEELGFPVKGFYRAYLDLAALGTIADVMPLIDENRVIARFGLESLPSTKKLGLQSLMRSIGLSPGARVSSMDVGFKIGPRLNASGRVDDARVALDLLLTKDPEEAERLTSAVEASNQARRHAQGQIIEEAVEMILAEPGGVPSFIVLASPAWHVGVIGIVAGRLVERFHRPTLVVAVDETTNACRGSARSVDGFNLADAIKAFPAIMSGGGHAAAAGCSFDVKDFEAVKAALGEYAAARLPAEPIPVLPTADIAVQASELTFAAIEEMQMLEPFGRGNPEPYYAVQAALDGFRPTKDGKHVIAKWQADGAAFETIGFNMAESFSHVGTGVLYDLLLQARIEEWNGTRRLKFEMKCFAEA
jgi:single-stranded-DNA-specific exonuclease